LSADWQQLIFVDTRFVEHQPMRNMLLLAVASANAPVAAALLAGLAHLLGRQFPCVAALLSVLQTDAASLCCCLDLPQLH